MIRRGSQSRVLVSLAALAFTALLVVGSGVRAAPGYGEPIQGQHIYDPAGVLTPDEVTELERHAQSVVQAGAPVVVYLQAKNASYDTTYSDAQDLMYQWDVQSAPDARDGLVIFFNLKPDDLHHGEVALYAGARHFDGGNLPKRELQRIFSDVMKPYLVQGNLAQGIAAGLDAAASSLRNGPPPPPPPTRAERLASDVSSGLLSPLNVVAVVLAGVFAWFTRKVWMTRPRSITPIAATTTLPDSTAPAIVGAVVTGHVRDGQIEATMLDLAHRGALAIDSEGKHNVQVKLIDASVPHNDVEHLVWESLERSADGDGIVTQSNLARVRSHWSPARDALEKHLVELGLFDPSASQRRRPVYLTAVGMLLLGAAAVAVIAIGKQPWGIIGATLLVVAGFAGIIAMLVYPNTSPAGAELAAQWSSYVAGIKRAKRDRTLDVNLDLDEAMPYAVAVGVASSLDKRLKQAADDGYAPAWLGPALYRSSSGINGYYSWVAFHSAVTPSSSGSAGGSGAASGGGGAGGSF